MDPARPDRNGTTDEMRAFWDEKARENAMYYISSYRPYDQQDAEEFWRWGTVLAERYLAESGLAFTGSEDVLEIGCGIGRMTRHFAGRFRHVTGIDVSPEMIRRAREHLADCPNVRLEACNGRDLSAFPDRSFDLVFSYIVFQHIPDPAVTLAYLHEAGRVLRDGGGFYFQLNTMPPVGALRRRLGALKRAVITRRRPAPDAPPAAGPRDLDHPAWVGSRVAMPRVLAALTAAGMRVVDVRGQRTQYTWIAARKLPGATA